MTDLIRRSVLIDEICRSSIYKWSVEEDQAAHNWALNIINSQPSVESSKGDLISRADAIDAVCRDCTLERKDKCKAEGYCYEVKNLKALPSADAVDVAHDIPEYCSWSQTYTNMVQSAMADTKSADAVPTVIRAKTFMRKEDFDKWAEDIKKQGENVICIPCDAEVVSAEAVHGEDNEIIKAIHTINNFLDTQGVFLATSMWRAKDGTILINDWGYFEDGMREIEKYLKGGDAE